MSFQLTTSFSSLFSCNENINPGISITPFPVIQVENHERYILVDRSDEDIKIMNSSIYLSNEYLMVYLSPAIHDSTQEIIVFEVTTSGDPTCRVFPAKFFDGECEGKRSELDSLTPSLPVILEMPDSPKCVVSIVAAYYNPPSTLVKVTRPFVFVPIRQ